MTEIEYLEIIGELKRHLEDVGLEGLARDEDYVGIYDDHKLPSAKQHLKEILASLERHLAVHDFGTYCAAIKTIRSVADIGGDFRASVLAPARDGQISFERDLADAPRLRGLRRSVKRLIRLVAEDEMLPPIGTFDG